LNGVVLLGLIFDVVRRLRGWDINPVVRHEE
jgi:hypothetical protein